MIRDYASESGFSCPTERPTSSGRSRPEHVIQEMQDIHGLWKKVEREACVSYKTLLMTKKWDRSMEKIPQNPLIATVE